MVKGGYMGKILRVDLTKGSTTIEDLPEESILRKYIGCFGLGLWYLMKELPAGVTPLEPENPLIFMNGPFTGTRIPCSNNCTITTLNANTGFTAGRAHSHGWFGPYMKMAGFDGIIITGASDKWVYLWIDDGKVELRDAVKFLGKDTHETEDLIKQDLGVTAETGKAGGASVAAIGPAGEHLCAGALIENDKNHSFAHSGVGTIMGSKQLKAIAVRGTGEVTVANEQKLASIDREWIKVTMAGGIAQFIGQGGIPKTDDAVKGILGISAKNWTASEIPGFGDGMSKQKITPRPCYKCPIGCSYDVEVVEGPYKGLVATLSGGGESFEGAAAIVGAGGKDPGEIFYLADLQDRLGLETSAVGCAMAVAFEAYEKGLLTKKDTDGLELKWGDVKVIETLLRRIANKEGGFATELAGGLKAAAQRVGLPDASINIKGAPMNLHHWRNAWAVLLGQAIGGGSGWGPPGAVFAPEADAGYPQPPEPLNPHGKGEEVAKTGMLKLWHDCNGTCWFVAMGITGILKIESSAMAATTGWEDLTPEELLKVGHRVLTLERIFNMEHGLTAEDDYKLSPRLTDPAPADAGPAAGLGIAPYIEGWVGDYYVTMGWERKTGKPLLSTLKNLGLED